MKMPPTTTGPSRKIVLFFYVAHTVKGKSLAANGILLILKWSQNKMNKKRIILLFCSVDL